MKCQDCPNYKSDGGGWCSASLWEDYPLKCFLKMMIQELRLLNIADDEGEDWKYE